MSTIFISHSSRDDDHAQSLREQLAEKEYNSVFLDFDPMDGIPAGQSWERTLYRKLSASDVVLVVYSENHRSSNWCFAEVVLARMEGKHVVTLLIDPDTDQNRLPSILTENQFVDLRDKSEGSLARLWRGLTELGVRPAAARAWNPENPPYPGMLAFDEREASIFFGREDETRKIVEMLNAARRREADRLLIVTGASGSGKSSIVRAGVIPLLRNDRQWVPIGPFRPGRQPVDELAAHLLAAFGGDPAEVAEIAARLRRTSISEVLVDLMRKSGRREATPLLIIDQFEELLTNHESANEFLHMVNEACASEDPVVHFMVTLRSDFTAGLHRRRDLPALLDAQVSYAVGPMQPTAMRRVITEPAKLGALEFEDGLVERLLDDTGTPDALPLLAFALRALWDRGHDDGILDRKEYEEIGGIGGAIAHEADAILGRGNGDGRFDDELRAAFVRMSRLGEDGAYVRVATHWDDHPESVHDALQRFVDKRILVSSVADDVRTVEIAHEALFRQWQPLREALVRDRASQRTREDIERAARDWTAKGRQRDLLYRGATLTVASAWEKQSEAELNEDGKEFLRTSRRHRRLRHMAAIAVSIGVVLLLALVGAYLASLAVQDAYPELDDRDLSGYDLSGGYLNYVDLSGSDLSGANLSKSSLWDADLTGADLQGADLTDACMRDVDFTEANLTGAKLVGADLSVGDNQGFILVVDALGDLEASVLIDANLTDADLTDADLTGADLTRADLTRAVLDGTNLSGARLSGVALSDAALVGIVYDDETEWPAGFVPPPPGRSVPEPACDREDW